MSDLVKRLRDDPGLADCEEAADRIETLEAAIKRQAGASKTLRELTLSEVRHLKDMDRSEYNATKTLDSEREANAILTAEIEALEQQVEAADRLAELSRRIIDGYGFTSDGNDNWREVAAADLAELDDALAVYESTKEKRE